MPIKNYTTKIGVNQTVAQIQRLSAMVDVDIYIDGENMEPTRVTFDASDSDVEGVYF